MLKTIKSRGTLELIPWIAAVAIFAAAIAPTPSWAEFVQVENVPADLGVIYLYRPRAFVASGQEMRIAVDGVFVAELYNGRYLPLTLPPGIHVVSISPYTAPLVLTPRNTPVDVNAEAGKSHYVRATWSMSGLFSSKVVFQGMDEREALAELAELRPSD